MGKDWPKPRVKQEQQAVITYQAVSAVSQASIARLTGIPQ